MYEPLLGATCSDRRARFEVWAPAATSVALRLLDPDRTVPMEPAGTGYFVCERDDVRPGTRYCYRLNGELERPDPASRYQPLGVHGPSEVAGLAPARPWRGPALEEYVMYELHTGTFTPEGTFQAAIREFPRLRRLGITAVEIMPVAAFPGERNWGYDGVYPYAVQASYGGPSGLRQFVDAAHAHGLAVVLDVVYNHLGPEGNYLRDFGPYFTDRYRTPWGDAVNFDGPDSDEVRRFFIGNALYWIGSFGIDSLRLDAVHAIYDRSAYPFLEELADAVHEKGHELGRPAYLIAESDLNDSRIVKPKPEGGLGLDSQWADDLHHAIHAQLTGESSGYYGDFGGTAPVADALRYGWCYRGQRSAQRKRRFGNRPDFLSRERFVVCTQNHDQIGNRMRGERLIHIAGLEKAKLAACCVLLSPYLPLLFMGEEYGEPAPFQYFVDHSDPELRQAVRKGRAEEFREFHCGGDPPEPDAEETFLCSKLNTALAGQGVHARLNDLYRELIRMRSELGALRASRENMAVTAADSGRTVVMCRWHGGAEVLAAFHFGDREGHADASRGRWLRLLDSSDERWGGPGAQSEPRLGPGSLRTRMAPHSCVVYGREP